ncbi:MAG: ABC transporter ATP-binding protein, partial [Candidatus Saccharibacteria bacterium]
METVRKTIRLYLSAVLKYKLWLTLHLFTVCAAVFCGSIVLPYIISRGVNALPGFVQNGGEFWPTFGNIIILFIVFQILAWMLWRTSGLAIVKLEIPVMRDLNQKVFNHLTTMSYRFFTNAFGGSLVSQTNRFVSCFERLYDVLVFDFVGIMVRFVFSSIVLFSFAPSVAVGLIIWSILFVASSLLLSIKKLPLSKKAAANQSKTTARLADNLTNMSNIKYFAREKYETKQFNKITQKLADSQYWDWGVG